MFSTKSKVVDLNINLNKGVQKFGIRALNDMTISQRMRSNSLKNSHEMSHSEKESSSKLSNGDPKPSFKASLNLPNHTESMVNLPPRKSLKEQAERIQQMSSQRNQSLIVENHNFNSANNPNAGRTTEETSLKNKLATNQATSSQDSCIVIGDTPMADMRNNGETNTLQQVSFGAQSIMATKNEKRLTVHEVKELDKE